MRNLNLYDGIINYNDFDIDDNVPFEEQKYSYKEDILQISYGDRFTLDVGWHREFNPRGYFIVKAVKDENWNPPLKKIKAKTLGELKKAIEKIALELSDKASRQPQKINNIIITPTKFIGAIKLLGGKITYNVFDINENIPLTDQIDSLREDLIQIEYGERFTLDIGWQPDFDLNGYFIVRVILDKDWEDPVSIAECNTLPELKKLIESAAILIHEQLKIKDLPFREVEYEKFD